MQNIMKTQFNFAELLRNYTAETFQYPQKATL